MHLGRNLLHNKKLTITSFIISMVLLFLTSCGGGSNSSVNTISSSNNTNDGSNSNSTNNNNTNDQNNFSGVAQKGPFTSGSQVLISQLFVTGKPTGKVIKTTSTGLSSEYTYDLPADWLQGDQRLPVEITVVGHFLDESDGAVSQQQITLNALLAAPSNSSINLLTHWVSLRAKLLILSKGLSVSDALKQATAELTNETGIEHFNTLNLRENVDSSVNTVDNKSDNAQLLLLSGALLKVAKIKNVSEQGVINDIAVDFATNGQLNHKGKAWFKRMQAVIRNNPKAHNNRFARSLNVQTGFNSNLKVPDGESLPEIITLASRPQAIAPEIILAVPGQTVVLDGSESHDSGNIVNFTWFRIDQQTQFNVPISDRFLASPSIVAPNRDSELLFALIVTDEVKLTDTTVVKVIVKTPPVVDPPVEDPPVEDPPAEDPPTFPPNQRPIANPESVVTDEDTPINITITGSDPDGGVIFFDVGPLPLILPHGMVEGIPPNLTYTPTQDYSGNDAFSFFVRDSFFFSAQAAIVDITINPINDKPLADPQAVVTDENEPLTILLSGSDVENDPLTFSIATPATNGSLDISAMPSVVYTPNSNFNGSDSFAFQSNDGLLSSDSAQVDITVLPVNGKPVAFPQNRETNQDVPLAILLAGLDSDNDPLTFTIVSSPTNGTLTTIPITGLPNITYTPSTGFSGDDSFTFKVNDGVLDSDVVTVNIKVVEVIVNHQPVANPIFITTDFESEKSFVLTGSDIDPNDILTFKKESDPTNGTLTGAVTNVYSLNTDLTYTPNTGFSGTDTFSYTVFDGTIPSNLALVTITVNPQDNVIPIAVATASPNPVISGGTLNLNGAASSDADNDPLTYQWVQTVSPLVTGLVPTAVNPVVTAPVVSDTTIITFSLVVNDTKVDSALVTVDVQVNPPANSKPIATSQHLQLDPADLPLVITLAGTDTDGTIQQYKLIELPPNGTAKDVSGVDIPLDVAFSSATINYTPNDNPAVADSFSFTVIDDKGLESDSATITIAVPANDAPIADAGLDQNVTENDTVTLSGSGTDPEDGVTSIFEWTTPAEITLSSDSVANPTFSAPAVTTTTTFTLSLIVRDSQNLPSPADTVVITVNPANQAPIANAGPDQAVVSGVLVTLDGTASSDPEDNTVTSYEWTAPPGVTLSSTSAAQPTFTTPVAASAPITLTFTLVVRDSQGLPSPEDTVVVTVNAPVNQAPTANAGLDQGVTVGDTVTLVGSGTDPEDGTTSIFEWTAPAGITLSSNTVANPTFTAPSVASAPVALTITLVVRDSQGLPSPADMVMVTVSSANIPPQAIATLNQAPPYNEGISLQLFGGESFDNDGTITNYLWEQIGTPVVTLSDPLAPNPIVTLPDVTSANAPLTLTFNLTVTDNDGDSNSTTIDIAVNGQPTANTQDTTLEFSTLDITLSGSDPEGGVLVYKIISAPALGMLSGITANVPFTSPNITYIPNSVPAADSFTFSVIDDKGFESSPVTVNILVANQAPIANSDEVTQEGGAPIIINLDDFAFDPDGDPLSYEIVSENAPNMTLDFTNLPKVIASGPLDVPVSGSFQYKVKDIPAGAESNIATIIVRFERFNEPPVAFIKPGASTPTVGNPFFLSGSGSSDPDGYPEPLTYQWSVITSPAGSIIKFDPDAFSEEVNVTADTAGTYEIQLTVSDGAKTGSATITIEVL